ncbi:MAG: alpha-glucan family phosphorylase [Deltaproteobacteria bacterium]|nr:alpha-glucan family phosphorylase [Deltaproteobacteria bacterium]
MPTLRRFTVVPRLPQQLERLRTLAYNLWWTWNHDARELFELLDPDLWEKLHQNPVSLLARIPQERLDDFAKDDAFLTALEARYNAYERYMGREGWFRTEHPDMRHELVAYFSMEFGLHECVPVYSGGLGVLAGDTLKTASDLDIPMVGVGIAYAEGYFRQVLNDDGWQMERYPLNDWADLPVTPVLDQQGQRLLIEVPYPGRVVKAQAWKVQVGRVPLLLLDTNLPANLPEDRLITNALYGGDNDHRVRQEILLGVGGIRMLTALGMVPTVCHMNEGHSAFLGIERILRLMKDQGVSFDVAREASSASNAFTTHTPVPAGLDQFDEKLVARYLQPFAEELGVSVDQLLALGNSGGEDPKFSMPVLAIRLSRWHNAVSELHGEVSRKMWTHLWPGVPVHEIPIGYVTNGVHAGSWTSAEVSELVSRYLGSRWREEADDRKMWDRTEQIPDAELWQAHQRRRMRMIRYCRNRLVQAAERKGMSKAEQQFASEALDPEALTIGFARRFATYKRATLLMRDLERLERLLCDNDRPVQFVFAGKAHPHDEKGKDLIRQIVHASRLPAFRGRIVFVEDYDMGIARRLVSGVDVWLNTPRRPHEASGTSGMKVAFNGVLNASVLDGWWAEAWSPEIGWAIGRGEEYEDTEYGDTVEAQALYQLLEGEIVPTFYERGRDKVPRRWVSMMKRSMAVAGSTFNTVRMTREYVNQIYIPAIAKWKALSADRLQGARDIKDWKHRVRAAWDGIRVVEIAEKDASEVPVNTPLHVQATLTLGGLTPDDVRVELYYGHLEGGQEIPRGDCSAMSCTGQVGDNRYRFEGAISSKQSGSHAYALRVVPRHPMMSNPFEMSLIHWA